ncbi:MAG: SGNH/GDSL hydrolase family protein [Magnetococcales bacterium]|nr:SGNH/GDSL hydrolase family protein [Magnetococcales bacterium]
MTMNGRIGAWRTAYTSVALLVFNTVLLLVLGNGVVGIGLNFYDPPQTPDQKIIAQFGQETLETAYSGKTWDRIQALLRETWSRNYTYEPFVQFRETAFSGTYVQVASVGFRNSGTPLPWPPDKEGWNVFLFGGSTTFGYGIEDGETIAAHLQPLLSGQGGRPVRVYNFGQGFYYSSQELIQFQRLLVAGIRPDAVMFLDGLNDFFHDRDQPFFTDRLRQVMPRDAPSGMPPWLAERSLVRLAGKIHHRLIAAPASAPEKDPAVIHAVIDRYLTNQTLIRASAQAYGIGVLFAWQPVPTWHHRPNQHLVRGVLKEHPLSGPGYEAFVQRLQKVPLDDHFVWCAEVQNGRNELLYVDRVHYNDKMSALIAECLAEGWLRLTKGSVSSSGGKGHE